MSHHGRAASQHVAGPIEIKSFGIVRVENTAKLCPCRKHSKTKLTTIFSMFICV